MYTRRHDLCNIKSLSSYGSHPHGSLKCRSLTVSSLSQMLNSSHQRTTSEIKSQWDSKLHDRTCDHPLVGGHMSPSWHSQCIPIAYKYKLTSFNINLASGHVEDTGGEPSYWPFALLPLVAGSTALDYTGEEYLYDPSVEYDFEYSQESADLYDELVREYPGIAVDLSDMLQSTLDASTACKNPNTLLSIHPIPKEDPGSLPTRSIGSTPAAGTNVQAAPTSSPPIATPRTLRGRTCRSKNFCCVVCGETFDRVSRARDCAFRDLGETPYACKGRSKISNW